MDWRLTLLAVALALPAPGVAFVVARKPVKAPADELRRTNVALGTVRWARAHVCALASYAAVLWFCEAGGVIDARLLVLVYTGMVVLALAAYLPWLRRLERLLLGRRADCRASIERIKRATGW